MAPIENPTFGQLLSGAIKSIAAYERKSTGVLDEELGEALKVASATIERYKQGRVPVDKQRVKILAEQLVKRAYLNHTWLRRFLQAAAYPTPGELLEQLFPECSQQFPGPARPPRVYHNLPVATYAQFIARPEAYARVIEGLQQQTAVVLIVGLGGCGKTSLARYIAEQCFKDVEAPAPMEAAIWVSDKDRPGTLDLTTVLDTIARTLDYPGLAQLPHNEKLYEVDQLLRQKRVLLVVDNIETITDSRLLDWLFRLPAPSKALVTSREQTAVLWSSWPIALDGFTPDQAWQYIEQRARFLGFSQPVVNQYESLVHVSGGNPKVIELALGYLKYEHQPFAKIIGSLSAAQGALFEDLFARSWSLLAQPAQQVLLALLLFSPSAQPEALAAVAAVSADRIRAIGAQLSDLALIDVKRDMQHSVTGYSLHPLVRTFATARAAEAEAFMRLTYQRWLRWYVDLVSHTDFAALWNSPDRLAELDREHETIFAAMGWAASHHQAAEVLKLARGIEYYYYIRGLWERRLATDHLAIDAARWLGYQADELEFLSFHVQLLCRRGQLDDAAVALKRLDTLTLDTNLSDHAFFYYQHAHATYAMVKGDIDSAQLAWETSMSHAQALSDHMYIANIQCLATCHYRRGERAKARRMYHDSLGRAREQGYLRYIVSNLFKLAEIELDDGNLVAARAHLTEAQLFAEKSHDQEHLARVQWIFGRMYAQSKDQAAAHMALANAIDKFERLGLRDELAEARNAFYLLVNGLS